MSTPTHFLCNKIKKRSQTKSSAKTRFKNHADLRPTSHSPYNLYESTCVRAIDIGYRDGLCFLGTSALGNSNASVGYHVHFYPSPGYGHPPRCTQNASHLMLWRFSNRRYFGMGLVSLCALFRAGLASIAGRHHCRAAPRKPGHDGGGNGARPGWTTERAAIRHTSSNESLPFSSHPLGRNQ